MYPAKIFGKDGELKRIVSAEECTYLFWKDQEDWVKSVKEGFTVVMCKRIGCKENFRQTAGRNIYCTKACAKLVNAKRLERKRLKKRPKAKCRSCYKVFYPVGSQRYCKNPCERPRYKKNPMEIKQCKQCNKLFETSNPVKVMCDVICSMERHKLARRSKARVNR